MNPINRLFKRRPRIDDRPIGVESRGQKIWNRLTLAPLRGRVARFLRTVWVFETPSWAPLRRAMVPKTNLSWYDYLNPVYWAMWLIGFLYQWVISRPYRNLGPALPAILTSVLVFGLGAVWSLGGSQQRNARYREQLTAAIRRHDYEIAKVLASKLVAVSPSDQSMQFTQALIDHELGDSESSDRRFWALANEKENAAAAAWLVQNRFELDDLQEWDTQQQATFTRLIEVSLKRLSGPAAKDLQFKYAAYLAGKGAIQQAAAMMAQAAATDPSLSLATAALYSQADDAANQDKWAIRAENFFRQQLLARPSDAATHLSLAQVLVLQEREDKAVDLLGSGYQLLKGTDPAGAAKLQEAGAEAYIHWSNRLATPNRKNILQRLNHAYRALQLAPNNQIVLDSTIKLLIAASKNEQGEFDQVRQAMLKGLEPASMHFVEGTVALLNGDRESARTHLELAMAENELPGVLNNLAVALHEQQTPDLEAALAFSEAALESLPEHPYLRETRGQILLKMDRFREAIPDLEAALTAAPIAQAAHESLAIAYDAIEQPVLAEQHRQLAARLQDVAKTN